MTKFLLKIANKTNDVIKINNKYSVESMTYIEIPESEISNKLWYKINELKDDRRIVYTFITKEYVEQNPKKKGKK